MTETERAPRLQIRRFDIFAEWNRLKASKKHNMKAANARAYGLAEVIVAKQRHGSTGKVRLKFDSRITKFSDAASESYLPEMRS
jgi:replicative DNA helicase